MDLGLGPDLLCSWVCILSSDGHS